MKHTFLSIFVLLIFGTIGKSQINHPQHFLPETKIILMEPTGNMVENLPEMKIIQDTSTLYKTVINNITSSFVDEFINFYFIAQTYLKNQNKLDKIEPAYLALTQKEGGFAKFGFSVLIDDENILKKETPYIDITKDRAKSPVNKLMSFTQLYPHEMGHVFFHLLCEKDTIDNNTKSVNIHYFSLITDYATALNEGFAEHIENVSRYYEKNEAIIAGISEDTKKIETRSKLAIAGFKRDFIYPFRLGYYKATMISWYQKYEDYKRYKQAFTGDIRYKNESIELSSVQDWISYRNSGVQPDKLKKRNLVQLHSTEGAISSFFTLLSTSKLINKYKDFSFYKPFLADTTLANSAPEEVFSPMENQFIKYFYVLNKFVTANNSQKSQFIDFIEGYLHSFPSEADELKKIYKQTFEIEYTNNLPPPLWIFVKDYEHRLLALDPFGAITAPMYTFDLNAAEIEDLLTINGFQQADAQKIIAFREKEGLFSGFEQLKTIPGLSKNAFQKITFAKFDQNYFETAFENYELKLNISDLLITPLLYIFKRTGIYFLILFLMAYFISIKREKPGKKKVAGLIVKYLLLWILFVVLGLTGVLFLEKVYFIPILLILLPGSLAFLIYRKQKNNRNRTLLMISVMCLLIFMSII